MSDVIGFGIVGTGRMASTMMAAFRQVPGIAVRAVASGDPERAQGFAKQHCIEAATSLNALLTRTDLQAVYVANANLHHASTSLQALQAGKAVLCEKPFAVSLEEGRAVIEMARQSGQLFLEAMWTPHLPAYRRLFELVRSGTIGEAVTLQADFGYPTEPDPGSMLFAPGPGAGVLLDRGVYPISLAIRLFGPAEQVTASIRRDRNGVDVTASLQITHAAGRVSQLACSLECMTGNSATVGGTGGHAKLMPPLVGSQAVFYRCMRSLRATREVSPAPGIQQRLKHALSQFGLAQRVRPFLEGKTEHRLYGRSQYLPLLCHFVEQLRKEESRSAIEEQQVSLDVLSVIDQARTA